ncbi:phosphatase PAP2 family protein [Belliella marina]|uniref:Phosphatase PAP2 family protein n=1 Tax=Belliella marina TaxID=1644146 RepID=A0ABW4VLC8_9BACT
MTFRKDIPAFTFYLLFGSVLIFMLVLKYSNKGFSLYINELHHPILDAFFKHITHLGDGLMLLLFLPIIFFKKSTYGIILHLGALIHLVFVYLGKQVFFHGAPRPMLVFQDLSLHVVEGVKIASYNTFPSGHTATAFLLAALLAQTRPRQPFYQFFPFLLALLVAFSRVYLMQHFLVDVLAGMWIGYFSFFAAKAITLRFPPKWQNFRLNQFLLSKLQLGLVVWKRRIHSDNYRYRRLK